MSDDPNDPYEPHWGDTDFGYYAGLGIAILATFLGIAACFYAVVWALNK